jgi:hypothetical protein
MAYILFLSMCIVQFGLSRNAFWFLMSYRRTNLADFSLYSFPNFLHTIFTDFLAFLYNDIFICFLMLTVHRIGEAQQIVNFLTFSNIDLKYTGHCCEGFWSRIGNCVHNCQLMNKDMLHGKLF